MLLINKVQINGRAAASQAEYGGSIPLTSSINKTVNKNIYLTISARFFCIQVLTAINTRHPNIKRPPKGACFWSALPMPIQQAAHIKPLPAPSSVQYQRKYSLEPKPLYMSLPSPVIKKAIKWKKATTAIVTFSVGMITPSEYANGHFSNFIRSPPLGSHPLGHCNSPQQR